MAPAAVVVNVCVPNAGKAIAAGLTARGCAAETITVTVAVFDVSSCEVAVTVTFPVVPGAVNTLPAKVPALADQFTALFAVKLYTTAEKSITPLIGTVAD